MIIVGAVGSIGSGKGTVGDILEKEGYEKISFAKTLKDAVACIFGWNRDLLEGDSIQSRVWREQPDAYWSKALGREITPRYVLQLMGTEAGRNVFGTDLWVHSLFKCLDRDKNYVITDVRFPNELAEIKNHGGIVFQINRGAPAAWYEEACYVNSLNAFSGSGIPVQVLANFPEVHYSEWAWMGSPYIDYVIENNSTIEDLEQKIKDKLTITKV